MQALILWAEPDSANLGVRTLARGTEALLRSTFPGAQTRSQGFGPGDAPVRIGNPRGQVKRLVSRHDDLVDWVRQFDFVVDTRAGDSFTDIYGSTRLATMSLMGEIVRRAKVPAVLGPQTVGPFGSRKGRLLARRTLATSSLVLARDPVSRSVAQRLHAGPVELTTDVVFALAHAPAVTQRRDVVVNPSGLLWGENAHVDHRVYRTLVTRLCEQLRAQGRRVSLLAHVLASPLADNDVVAVQALAAELGGDVEVLIPTGLDDVRQLLASARVVVGSRMHACLNALSVGRPSIPLAYSRKFAPLLDGLGWSRTIDLRSEHDHVAQVLSAIDEPTLDDAVAQVHERAAELVQQAREALVRAL